MPNPYYQKKAPGAPPWLGPRSASSGDLAALSLSARSKVDFILEAMEWPELVVFGYLGSDRVVAPFVVGVSDVGNALVRGYQLEGVSRSGKGEGWRVFQVDQMDDLQIYDEFFDADDFAFDRFYPWIYKVFRMV